MKTVFSIILLFLSLTSFSQEVFKNQENNNDYLFIGGIDGINIKALNTKNAKIEWVNVDSLEQIGWVKQEDFMNLIFASDLYFEGDGNEPFWRAELRKNTLIFYNGERYESIKQEYSIKTVVNKQDSDYSFYIMFQSTDKTVFGLIRSLGFYPKEQKLCDGICDENSVFEIYINHKGDLYKGCAIITKD